MCLLMWSVVVSLVKFDSSGCSAVLDSCCCCTCSHSYNTNDAVEVGIFVLVAVRLSSWSCCGHWWHWFILLSMECQPDKMGCTLSTESVTYIYHPVRKDGTLNSWGIVHDIQTT